MAVTSPTSSSSGEFSRGKTIFVLAVVIGCFAILWPKIFYPMLSASLHPPEEDCCSVISEDDVNAVKLVNEMCGNIALRRLSQPEEDPGQGQQQQQQKKWKKPIPTGVVCRNEILKTCGVDVLALTQQLESQNPVISKQFIVALQLLRSHNTSACLKISYGIDFGVPRRFKQEPEASSTHMRPERPIHFGHNRQEHLHPALREKGSAIPPPPVTVQRTLEKEARPGPYPGVRPPVGGSGYQAPPPKGGGTMGIVMPLYTIAIVVFFVYTIMKILFRKSEDKQPIVKDFGMDPQHRKYVLSEEYVPGEERSLKDQMNKEDRDAGIRRRSSGSGKGPQRFQEPRNTRLESEGEANENDKETMTPSPIQQELEQQPNLAQQKEEVTEESPTRIEQQQVEEQLEKVELFEQFKPLHKTSSLAVQQKFPETIKLEKILMTEKEKKVTVQSNSVDLEAVQAAAQLIVEEIEMLALERITSLEKDEQEEEKPLQLFNDLKPVQTTTPISVEEKYPENIILERIPLVQKKSRRVSKDDNCKDLSLKNLDPHVKEEEIQLFSELKPVLQSMPLAVEEKYPEEVKLEKKKMVAFKDTESPEEIIDDQQQSFDVESTSSQPIMEGQQQVTKPLHYQEDMTKPKKVSFSLAETTIECFDDDDYMLDNLNDDTGMRDRDARDVEIDMLRKRLEETEQAMARIVTCMTQMNKETKSSEMETRLSQTPSPNLENHLSQSQSPNLAQVLKAQVAVKEEALVASLAPSPSESLPAPPQPIVSPSKEDIQSPPEKVESPPSQQQQQETQSKSGTEDEILKPPEPEGGQPPSEDNPIIAQPTSPETPVPVPTILKKEVRILEVPTREEVTEEEDYEEEEEEEEEDIPIRPPTPPKAKRPPTSTDTNLAIANYAQQLTQRIIKQGEEMAASILQQEFHKQLQQKTMGGSGKVSPIVTSVVNVEGTMEMENGHKIRRSPTPPNLRSASMSPIPPPVSTLDKHPLETLSPEDIPSIYLEGRIPSQAQVLVSGLSDSVRGNSGESEGEEEEVEIDLDNEEEPDSVSAPVILSGKVTLSVIAGGPDDQPTEATSLSVDDYAKAISARQQSAAQQTLPSAIKGSDVGNRTGNDPHALTNLTKSGVSEPGSGNATTIEQAKDDDTHYTTAEKDSAPADETGETAEDISDDDLLPSDDEEEEEVSENEDEGEEGEEEEESEEDEEEDEDKKNVPNKGPPV